MNFEDLPKERGIYYLYTLTKNKFLRLEYIGKTENFQKRFVFRKKRICHCDKFWWKELVIIPYPNLNKKELENLEIELIKMHNPVQNKQHRMKDIREGISPEDIDYIELKFLTPWGE